MYMLENRPIQEVEPKERLSKEPVEIRNTAPPLAPPLILAWIVKGIDVAR